MKLKTCIHVPATNVTLCINMILAQLFINYAKYTKTNISNGSCVIIQTLAHTSNLFLLLLLVYFLVFFFCHPLVLDVHPNISGYSLFLLVPYGHAGIVHLCLKKQNAKMLTPRLQNSQNNDSHNGGYSHLSFIMYIVYNFSVFVCFSVWKSSQSSLY